MTNSLFKKIALSLSIAGCALTAQAQVTTYETGFEASSKTGYTLGTIDADGYSWDFSGAMIGTDSARDVKNGSKAARLRRVDSIPVYIQLNDNLSNISSLSFYYSRSRFSGDTSGISPTVVVYHTSDDGASWIPLDTINLAGVNTLTAYNKSFSPLVNGRFRIAAVAGDNGKRFNIDDVTVISSTPLPMSILDKTPVGIDVPLTTSQLTIKYSAAVEQNTAGNIVLMKSGTTTPVKSYTIPSAEITISGDSTAVMSGISLENNTTYYVMMTEGAFRTTAGIEVLSPAIADTNLWRFTTVDTTPPPPPPTYTSLNETFTDCNSAASSMGVFTQYSIEGSKRWLCSSFGRTDSHSVYINGGSAPSVSEINKDYLISKGKFDFSSMSTPKMSFWHKKRYEGDVTLKVKISTSYTGTGDPTLVTWTDIHTTAMPAGSNTWEQILNIDLTPYKSSPFYLAFYYECGAAGAYEYSLDDLKVENITSILGVATNNNAIKVLGNPTNSNITLAVDNDATQNYSFEVIDMSGRVIANHSMVINAGTSSISLNNLNLGAGLYIIKAVNAKGAMSTVKAVVR